MLKLLNRNFKGRYDYFYLPMDLKTQCSVGFAFINFTDALFILDFYLKFHCMKWSDVIKNCNSTKYVEIVYANMQGIDEIKKELLDKNIMKKNDNNIKRKRIFILFIFSRYSQNYKIRKSNLLFYFSHYTGQCYRIPLRY